MSTRATVIIKDSNTGEKCYLYHHCDGYQLDGGLTNLLGCVLPSGWTVKNLKEIIIDMDDAYGAHKVDNVGWDSEYVYVIDAAYKTLKKYECGLWFMNEHQEDNMDIEEEKTQEKYRIGQWAWYQDAPEAKPDEGAETTPLHVENFARINYLRGIAALQKSLTTSSLKRMLNLTDEEIEMVFTFMTE